MNLTAIIKKFFYLFLDITGSLLGVFLITMGWWSTSGRPTPPFASWALILLGIAALIIHAGHYIVSLKHGSDYFYTTRKNPDTK